MKQKQSNKHTKSRPSPALKQQEEAARAMRRAVEDKDPHWVKHNMLHVAQEALEDLGWKMNPLTFIRLVKGSLINPEMEEENPAQRLIARFGGTHA